MAIAAREYVLTRHIGPPGDYTQLLPQLNSRLDAIETAGHIRGYYAQVCYDLDDLEWADIDPAAALPPVGSKYPLLWLNITYDPDTMNVELLRPVEEEFGCVLINSGRSRN